MDEFERRGRLRANAKRHRGALWEREVVTNEIAENFRKLRWTVANGRVPGFNLNDVYGLERLWIEQETIRRHRIDKEYVLQREELSSMTCQMKGELL